MEVNRSTLFDYESTNSRMILEFRIRWVHYGFCIFSWNSLVHDCDA